MSHSMHPVSDASGRAARLIAGIDQQLSRQLDAVLHHPSFQAMEAAWRGLHMLVQETPNNRRTRISLLNVSWSELCRDMERSLEFDQSMLFWKLHTTEFDMPGGEPFGVVVCNYSPSHKNPSDIRTLRRIAAVAEASFCTMLFPAEASLLGMDSFDDFHPSVVPRQLFREAEYRQWQSLRKESASRFMAFVMPGVMLRKPWGMTGLRRGKFPYLECCETTEDFLWGHPGFVLARVLLREFEDVGWFAHVRGAPRDTLAGGIVANMLPAIQVDPCDELASVLPNTRVVISDAMERELSECGLISLVHCWQTAYSAFFSLPSLFSPGKTNDKQLDKNNRAASQLQNTLCASRFAHYIKVMMREKIGSFMNAEECQNFMEEWLGRYCSIGDNQSWSMQARYPLRSMRLDVREKPMQPGHYLCDISLTPHYQHEGLVGEVKLSTEIARAQT